MALLFSAVTVTAGEDEVELLVGGIPREYDDLEGWSEFDDLMYFISALRGIWNCLTRAPTMFRTSRSVRASSAAAHTACSHRRKMRRI